MTATADTELAAAIGQAILGDARSVGGGVGTGGGLDADQHRALVRRAAAAERASRDLLHQAVASARAGGLSWAALGEELALSRQAVQQRFGGAARATDDPGPEERWLGPVTAFDEMAELALAGRMGWRTVGVGMLKHRMVRTDTQWEHRRVLAGRAAARLEGDGWQVACRAFPWVYLVNDLGVAPEVDPPPTGAEGVIRSSPAGADRP